MTEEQELQRRSPRPRLFQLDALRGLAAVTVIFHHFHAAYPTLPFGWFFVLFGSGSSAVVLFFVLSGYVLSLPAWDGKTTRYSIYLVRRLCRIYLPFAAAAALSIAADIYFRQFHPPLTAWYQQTWHSPVSLRLVLLQLSMWPIPRFNTAFWSLFYEMEMSLVMPLLCVALKRGNAIAITLVSYVSVYLVLPLAGVDAAGHPVASVALRTLQVMCHFLLGATLAKHAAPLRALCQRLSGWLWLALPVGLYAYWDLPLIKPGPLPGAWGLSAAAGSVAILLCALHLPALARGLEGPVCEYLGRVSYSLYLMHGIVLFATLDLLYGRLPTAALLAIVVIASVGLAHVFCVAVEEPSMRLGKKLAQRGKNRSTALRQPAARGRPEELARS